MTTQSNNNIRKIKRVKPVPSASKRKPNAGSDIFTILTEALPKKPPQKKPVERGE
jgi:hypothetical protein